jgi:hypothetical protein
MRSQLASLPVTTATAPACFFGFYFWHFAKGRARTK